MCYERKQIQVGLHFVPFRIVAVDFQRLLRCVANVKEELCDVEIYHESGHSGHFMRAGM